jgi:hypothetical protein
MATTAAIARVAQAYVTSPPSPTVRKKPRMLFD